MTEKVFGPLIFILLTFVFIGYSDGWRAIPANQAMYAMRSLDAGRAKQETPDELLPRTSLHSIYKFGYCPPNIVNRQFLRSRVNMSFESYWDSHADYIYVLGDAFTTVRFKLQCIVMRMYVPRKYLFRRSRIPIYYCQGHVYILMFNTSTRLAIHEFYMASKINMPMDIYFEFYHPNIL